MAQTQEIVFENPVLPPAVSEMAVDVLVNDMGKVWVAYDRPFETSVQWLEYDLDLNRLVFVLRDGRMQDFGLTINAKMRKLLATGRSVWLVRVVNKTIEDAGEVPLLVRQTGFKPWGGV